MVHTVNSLHHTAGLHSIWPAGHMRPARAFLAAREGFLNCSKCYKEYPLI